MFNTLTIIMLAALPDHHRLAAAAAHLRKDAGWAWGDWDQTARDAVASLGLTREQVLQEVERQITLHDKRSDARWIWRARGTRAPGWSLDWMINMPKVARWVPSIAHTRRALFNFAKLRVRPLAGLRALEE